MVWPFTNDDDEVVDDDGNVVEPKASNGGSQSKDRSRSRDKKLKSLPPPKTVGVTVRDTSDGSTTVFPVGDGKLKALPPPQTVGVTDRSGAGNAQPVPPVKKVCPMWLQAGSCKAGFSCPDRHPPEDECEMLRMCSWQSWEDEYIAEAGKGKGGKPSGSGKGGTVTVTGNTITVSPRPGPSFGGDPAMGIRERRGPPSQKPGVGGQFGKPMSAANVCIFYLSSSCRQQHNCPQRHPPEKECEMLRQDFRRKQCRFGIKCQTEGCLYGHATADGSVDMGSLTAEDEEQLDKWVEAKRNHDFALADRIGAGLKAKGIRPDSARPHVRRP